MGACTSSWERSCGSMKEARAERVHGQSGGRVTGEVTTLGVYINIQSQILFAMSRVSVFMHVMSVNIERGGQ